MEATFSLSRHFHTKPIFTPHLHGVHVDHACYRQPSPSPQSWPTPMIRTHRLTWAVDYLPKPTDHGWGGGKPAWPSSQGEFHYKAWAVNSLPKTRKANGGDDTRPWTTAFITMTAVAACVAGAAFGMRGAMVGAPAIAAFSRFEIIAKDVVASEELKGFLHADLRRPSAERIEDAITYVFNRLRDVAGSRIDYPDLKENARVVVASGEAEEMMKMLENKFSEESIRGGEKALELGLIYLEMLILQVRPVDALLFLNSPAFKKIVGQNDSGKDRRPYLYEAAAILLSDRPDEEAKAAWNMFANAENLRRSPFQDGPKIPFEELRRSMTELKHRHGHPHWTKIKDFFRWSK